MCVVLVGLLNVSVAVAKSGTYGPIVPQRVWTRAEKRPVEEALLNFRIEAVAGDIVPKGCGADLKLDSDRRLLDPQLPTSNRRGNFDSLNSPTCTEIEPVSPLNP
jgi:hypothetical protein